jgi:peroxiredoxin
MSRTKRYLIVLILSFPFALGVRYVLGRALREDLPTATKAYVRSRKDAPLSEPLSKLLANKARVCPPSKSHPLLGKSAHPIALRNDRGDLVRFDPADGEGPTVLVFYYGYQCIHCVAQLFALNEDIALFEELGARVIAISDDSPEHTAAQFKKFGRFQFTVLSDPENRLAQQYGVYQPASEDQPERRQHGTFLIGPDGKVFWVDVGNEPFLDNQSLLIEMARHAGR